MWILLVMTQITCKTRICVFACEQLKNKRNNACILKVKSCLLFLFILSSFLNASPYSRNIYFLYLLGITFYKCVENMVFLLSILFCFFYNNQRHTDKKFFFKRFSFFRFTMQLYFLRTLNFILSLLFWWNLHSRGKCLLLPRFHCCLYAYEYVKR